MVSLLPDNTGWAALYLDKNSPDEPRYLPLIGWGLADSGEIVAMVPSIDGTAVVANLYSGRDGELTFDGLTCGCDDEEEGTTSNG